MSDAELFAEREMEHAPQRGVRFLKLRAGQCRFPLGDSMAPAERFCGQPASIGSPYCPDCRRIAYKPDKRTAAGRA